MHHGLHLYFDDEKLRNLEICKWDQTIEEEQL